MLIFSTSFRHRYGMETGLITGTKRRGAQNRDLTEVKLGQMREMNNQAVKGGVGPPKLEVSIIDESMMSSVYASPHNFWRIHPHIFQRSLFFFGGSRKSSKETG
jgi:hypothetical protein